jgi:glucose/mannose-6-phosphate isomerase
MNLDDLDRFGALDPQGMLDHIDGLPGQLAGAWEMGRSLQLATDTQPRQALLAGMGGSAIGADLVAAFAASRASLPIVVWRDYGLPAWAGGPETLVVVSSHSGNTEESLSVYAAARKAHAQLLAITTGGELARRAAEDGVNLWRFEHRGQPRAAVGFSAALVLAALHRMGALPDPAAEIRQAVEAMRAQQVRLRAQVPAAHNPAKRMAGQFVDRWPVVMGSGILAPVARRWRTQLAELAKSLGQFELLPEADHNMLAGVQNPESMIPRAIVLVLRSSLDHPRNVLRQEATRQILMLEGFNTDLLDGEGPSPMAHQWTALHFGDYVAFYLAMAYGVDPTPIPAIESLKQRMAQAAPG